MQCEWLLAHSVLLISVSVVWQAELPAVAAGTDSFGINMKIGLQG